MSNHISSKATLTSILSLPEVMRLREPRIVFENRLVALLAKRLKELDITWSPVAFRGGLHNLALPVRLLKKLESLLLLAETCGWELSRASREELDATIEDVETFNPAFRRSLARASVAIKAGRFVSQEKLEKRYGMAKS